MELAEVKRAMNRKVLYQPASNESTVSYVLNGCILRRRENGEFFYQAELMDVTTKNSVIICSLDDVQQMKEAGVVK